MTWKTSGSRNVALTASAGAVPHESVGVVVFAVNDSVRNVFDGVFDDVDVEKLL